MSDDYMYVPVDEYENSFRCGMEIVFFTREKSPEAQKQITDCQRLLYEIGEKEEDGLGRICYNYRGLTMEDVFVAIGGDMQNMTFPSEKVYLRDVTELTKEDDYWYFFITTGYAHELQLWAWDEVVKKYPMIDFYFLSTSGGKFVNTDKTGRFIPWRYYLSADPYWPPTFREMSVFLKTEEAVFRFVKENYYPDHLPRSYGAYFGYEIKTLDDIDQLFARVESSGEGSINLFRFGTSRKEAE